MAILLYYDTFPLACRKKAVSQPYQGIADTNEPEWQHTLANLLIMT